MSSDSFVAYFGLKFEVSPQDVQGLEDRSDLRIISARKDGLKYYWGNFGVTSENYIMLIGEEIAILGYENSMQVSIPISDPKLSFFAVKEKLDKAGFVGAPELHLIFHQDV